MNAEIFNIGSDSNNYRLADLGQIVAQAIPRDVEIEWYGDPDHRSYRVSFEKLESIGFRATRTAQDGVADICQALDAGLTDKTSQTITLDWYKALTDWHELTKGIEMYGGIVNL